MLGASNIRWILRDTLAILVWHAVFSSLWNTFKALKDMPAWPPGFFSQIVKLQFTIFISLTYVACLFGKHATPVTGTLVANGPSPTALMFCHASSRLPGFSICCPHSGKRGKCEAMNVWGKVCWCAQRLLGCCLDCCNGDREAVFIYPAHSCHCCVWSEFTEVRTLGRLGDLSNPKTLPTMQNVIA